jgi:hypothetical protein
MRAFGNPEVHPVITAEKLKRRTAKDLASMAKRKKIPGWHSMRKQELVRALVKQARSAAAKKARSGKLSRSSSKNKRKPAAEGKLPSAAKRARTPYTERRLRQIKAKLAASKDLTFRSVSETNGQVKDRLVVMVRDPYWLHAYWELSRASVERAKAAMGQHWHGAQPVLRLNQVARNGTTSSATQVVRDIPIHGGVNNWYVDVHDPPKSYQMEIGYLAANGKFFPLARSNTVSTPRVGAGGSFDQNWAEVAKDFDRIYAMSGGYDQQEADSDLKEVFEEQLRRPMGDPMTTRFGGGAAGSGDKNHEFRFHVDTELIVHGATEPGAHVTLKGEPIHLRSDGTFAIRFTLPDRRHVLPVVASSRDGTEQHTIVLAVDRNTKVMEPVIRDPGE